MGLELVNQHAAKVLLAVEDGDSINRISEKAGSSYSYTYEWIEKLEAVGVLERSNGVRICDQNFRDTFQGVARTALRKDLDLDEAYLLPNFSGFEYRFSKTDAVYIWTKGGYQIGRNRRDYPVFIDVLEDDVEEWQEFFGEFGVETSVEDRIEEGEPGIYFVLFPRDEFDSEWVENSSVTPLRETVEWMEKYRANFQPALEMLDEMYELNLGAEYRERELL